MRTQVYGFSSAKKMASVLVDQGNGTLRLYNKGASEWVLDASVSVYEADGSVVPLTPQKKAALMEEVTAMASRGLRTLVRPRPAARAQNTPSPACVHTAQHSRLHARLCRVCRCWATRTFPRWTPRGRRTFSTRRPTVISPCAASWASRTPCARRCRARWRRASARASWCAW